MQIISDSEESNENKGGCLAKDVHDEMRNMPVDVGGKETTEKKLMRPQTGDEVDAG